MDNFKFTLFSIFILGLLGFSGYWAFSTIESGSTHVDNQKQKELEQQNEELTKELAQAKTDYNLLEAEKEAEIEKEQQASATTTPGTTATPTGIPTNTTVSKYQSLIDDLQKLVDSKIYLKNKSQGIAVGTLQKFLNIFNNTSTKVDNDYGVSVATAVKAFQKAEGLTQDGQVGPGTFQKMISWLKTQ